MIEKKYGVVELMAKSEDSDKVEEVDPLEAIFDEFLQGPRVFLRRDVLTDRFIPDKLPHRNEEIKVLGYTLASVLRGARPSNLFLYGKTGTGKTAATKFVLNRLGEKAKDQGFELRSAYVNCQTVDTNYRVFAELCHHLNVQVPFTGLPSDEVFSRLCNALDSKGGFFIIVLDEVDALVKKSGSETLYQLTRINTVLKEAKVSLIGISNDLKFKEYLDARVLSSLSEEEVVFKPYNAVELRDILEERAKMAFIEGALEDGVIPLIAAIAAREHGDARRAIDLLRVSGEIAERKGSTRITTEHVKLAMDSIERNTVKEVINTLPLQSKVVIVSIYKGLHDRKGNVVSSGELYEIYQDTCKELHVDILSQRRVSDLINELDTLGIICTRVVSRGRYGRTKEIQFAVAEKLVLEALKSDSLVSSLF